MSGNCTCNILACTRIAVENHPSVRVSSKHLKTFCQRYWTACKSALKKTANNKLHQTNLFGMIELERNLPLDCPFIKSQIYNY